MQHAKMKCNAFCHRSFQDETGCIVLNLLESAQKVLRVSAVEGITVVLSLDRRTKAEIRSLVAGTER